VIIITESEKLFEKNGKNKHLPTDPDRINDLGDPIKHRYSLFYAIIINTLIIIGITFVICWFTLNGGIWNDSLVIFSSLILILLFTLLEGLNLIKKEIESNNNQRKKNSNIKN